MAQSLGWCSPFLALLLDILLINKLDCLGGWNESDSMVFTAVVYSPYQLLAFTFPFPPPLVLPISVLFAPSGVWSSDGDWETPMSHTFFDTVGTTYKSRYLVLLLNFTRLTPYSLTLAPDLSLQLAYLWRQLTDSLLQQLQIHRLGLVRQVAQSDDEGLGTNPISVAANCFFECVVCEVHHKIKKVLLQIIRVGSSFGLVIFVAGGPGFEVVPQGGSQRNPDFTVLIFEMGVWVEEIGCVAGHWGFSTADIQVVVF